MFALSLFHDLLDFWGFLYQHTLFAGRGHKVVRCFQRFSNYLKPESFGDVTCIIEYMRFRVCVGLSLLLMADCHRPVNKEHLRGSPHSELCSPLPFPLVNQQVFMGAVGLTPDDSLAATILGQNNKLYQALCRKHVLALSIVFAVKDALSQALTFNSWNTL